MSDKPLHVGVMASGRGSNFVAVAQAIEREEIPARIAVLITDRPGAACVAKAREFGIATVELRPKEFEDRAAYDRHCVAVLKEHGVRLVLLAGYMRIVTPDFIDGMDGQVMNIHPALLPAFPGLHGQRQALEYGVKLSGATVHFVTPEMDAGPIIIQRAVDVLDDDDEDSLSARILEVEHEIYPEAVRRYALGMLDVKGRRVRTRGGN